MTDWYEEVSNFLVDCMPQEEPGEWVHMYSSAYQMGCMALIALGLAQEIEGGASKIGNPRPPRIAPRWDDICAAVINLAFQKGELTCFSEDHYPPKGDPAEANIPASKTLGMARISPEYIVVFEKLGLVKNMQWTPEAELEFWRHLPKEWGMNIDTDPRFSRVVDQAVQTVPDDINTKFNKLVTITKLDIRESVEQSHERYEEHRKKYGPKAKISPPVTPEQAIRSIEFGRQGQLNWIFFRRWRLSDGWLSETEAENALEIFHDRLANKVRKSVMTKLYPNIPFAANGY